MQIAYSYNGIWHPLPIWAQLLIATAVIIPYVYPVFALAAVAYLRKKEAWNIQYGFGASKKRKKWAGIIWRPVAMWPMLIVSTLLCYGAFGNIDPELRKACTFFLGISPIFMLAWAITCAEHSSTPPKWPEPLEAQQTG